VATSRAPLARLRRLCLAFPEAHEVEAWGEPTFRGRNKMFAMLASAETHPGAGRPAVWIKSTHVVQDMLVRGDGSRYFVPPYVGKSGWVGAYLDRVAQWETLRDLLLDAYRLAAPKSLAAGAAVTPRRTR
jgi:predicted DNA-binding protein (MmcQ/YjbR family)